jgi:class 3 adenylate cyclase/tetratricopeptide (TPR) repeat protein
MPNVSQIACVKCGTNVIFCARFCVECGAPVGRRCDNCGFSNPGRAKFCGGCSKPLRYPLEIGSAADETDSPQKQSPSIQAEEPYTYGELRRLTVMFADLVDSTQISIQLDPESWRGLIARYQKLATVAVTSFGGHVGQYLGDGIVVSFGLLEAHDDDAERAVRSALLLLEGISDLNEALKAEGLPQLGVRVGIHTGRAMVTESDVNQPGIFGDTPNIAARVQAEAVRHSVFITSAVHRLIAGLFIVEDCGKRALKGVSDPVQLFRVIRPSGMRSRLDVAAATHSLTPFVGRQDEFQTLSDRWTRALRGEGQLVWIVGEPGIGKSRLIHEFRQAIAGTPHTWIECAGSPLFQNAPFHPVSELLQQAFRLASRKPEESLRELQTRLQTLGLDPREGIAFIAPLVNLPLPEGVEREPSTPESQHRKVLSFLVKWICASAEVQPLVLVVEDLQWLDPSTLLLQEFLAEQGSAVPMILLLTSRPEFRLHWPPRAHHVQIALSRLSPSQVVEIIEGISAKHSVAREVVDAVVKRAGGIPLFVEELTRLVLDAGEVTAAHEIPVTLHDSLMARLDRMGPAREVVKVAAAIGGEFTYELLRTVTAMSDVELQAAVKKAIDGEVLYARGVPPDASYLFKHALLRDVAYAALLKGQRRELHHVIARAIADQTGSETPSRAELMAHHLTQAGEFEAAIAEWSQAGRRAVARGALEEAESLFSRAVELADKLDDGPELVQRKLNAYLSLAQVMQSTHGFAVPELDPIYARAHALAARLGSPVELVYTLTGIWSNNLSRRKLNSAHAIADEILTVAKTAREPNLLVWAHYAVGTTCYQRGNLVLAYDNLKRARALYREQEDQSTPHDAGVSTLAYLSRTAWHLGLSETARIDAAEALSLAQRQNKPAAKALALSVAAGLYLSLGEPQRAEEFARQLENLAKSQHMPFFLADSEILKGAAMADQGRLQEGIEWIRGGLARQAPDRRLAGLGYYTCFLSRALASCKRFDEATAAIDEAFKALPEQEIDHVYLRRLRGEILLQRAELIDDPESARDEAEHDFTGALELARLMGAKQAELLCATGLARLLISRGRRDEACRLLAPICASYEGDPNATVLETAKSLLAAFDR